MGTKGKHTRLRAAALVLAACLVCVFAALAIGTQHEPEKDSAVSSNEPVTQAAEQAESNEQGEQSSPPAGTVASPETASPETTSEGSILDKPQNADSSITNENVEDPGANIVTPAPPQPASWTTGMTLAYGDSGSPARTATGDVIDGNSMGVAIPLSMPDYRSYFGRAVQISYDGKTVIATINDCGVLSGRSLDLQPGVVKAFGFSDCASWGVREVSYMIL